MCINLFVDIIVAQQERKIKTRKKKLVLNEIERHRTNSLKNYNSQNNLDTFMLLLLFSCVLFYSKTFYFCRIHVEFFYP